jgi:hypothetical protein
MWQNRLLRGTCTELNGFLKKWTEMTILTDGNINKDQSETYFL